MGDSADQGYAMMTRMSTDVQIQSAWRFKEKWRYVPLPDSLKELVRNKGDNECGTFVYDFGMLEDGLRPSFPGKRANGIGLTTQYATWLQEALQEGSWLKTRPILSQFRARKPLRQNVEFPALVQPLDPELVRNEDYSLLWARRWKNADEHIGIKEARVALSSLKRTCRVASLFGMKKLTLSDNLPAILCFEKGRSSRPTLNRLCKVSAAIQGGTGIRWRLRHVETKRNVADTPSRWFERACRSSTSSAFSTNSSFAPGIRISLYEALQDTLTTRQAAASAGHQECGLPQTTAPSSGSFSSHRYPVEPQPLRQSKKPPGLYQRGCFLEIFSGEGHLTEAIRKSGQQALDPIDICHGHEHDLLRRSTQVAVKKLVKDEEVKYLHCGTPCICFSTARHNIRNTVRARERERVACELVFFTVELIRSPHARGGFWSIENPRSSRLWDFPAIRELMMLEGVSFVNFPMCQYGARYKKPTSLLTNYPFLKCLAQECPHKRHGEVLRGRVRVERGGKTFWTNRTTLAGSYPKKLCNKWAQAVKARLLNVEEKPRADPGRTIEALRKSTSESNDKVRFFNLNKEIIRCPKFLDSITFGQHTKAEAATRQRLRRSLARGKV